MNRSTALLILLLLAALGAAATPAAATPRCYGAAARDPEQPCHSDWGSRHVTPTPDAALLEPDGPCDPVGNSTELCTFGEHPTQADGTIAMFGDSHARHYRVTVQAVTKAHRLFAWSLTRPHCPFSFATPAIPEPDRSECVQHNRDVVTFAEDHPAIGTVFVSENRGDIIPARRDHEAEERIQGYVDAWDALPRSVTHVIVLRDPFYDLLSTPDCVNRAIRRHRDAGRDCAMRRGRVLKIDPAVVAARRPHRDGLRVDAIDFTPFMCGAKRCFPVVGGVLVHKDIGHLTEAFAATLGPYLLRAFDRLPA